MKLFIESTPEADFNYIKAVPMGHIETLSIESNILRILMKPGFQIEGLMPQREGNTGGWIYPLFHKEFSFQVMGENLESLRR